MKNRDRTALKKTLLAAIKKAIKTSHAYLSKRTEKDIRKSIKRIVRKTDKMNHKVSKVVKKEKPGLKSAKIKMDGAALIS